MAQLGSELLAFWISALPAELFILAGEGDYCQAKSQHLQKALDKLAG